jgi:predicted MPP superfamily phosphohydrolase/VanZ family protein
MNVLLSPFVLVVTALLALSYAYVAARLTSELWERLAIALPFVLVWVVPVLYWSRRRDREESRLDDLVHQASYLAMAWVSFVLVLTLVRDLLLAIAGLPALAPLRAWLVEFGDRAVLFGSIAALALGVASAVRGPRVTRLRLPVPGLHPDLEGFRIVQISDLHVGRSIRRGYVERTVELARSLEPDLVALTGDLVDGPVPRLADDIAPLAALALGGRAFLVLGNHDCYADAAEWITHFRVLGLRVLLNDQVRLGHRNAELLVGGLVDPAYRFRPPEIESAADVPVAFRLLLAHNPKLAPLGARAGYDLQLSGHTHAGQFFPWTLAVRLVHAPHVAGLSKEGHMRVYVSAGTGSWGPPVRFGTTPEITLLTLVAA